MADVAYVGRLAPSPTGALHLGNARTFLIAWLRARSVGGRLILRMEDLDHPRDKPGAADDAIADLRWLGLDWDETMVQSARRAHYREALEFLRQFTVEDGPMVYPCVCSRKDVEAAQSAPHDGEQLHYPGCCRNRFDSWAAAAKLRPPCWRFRVPTSTTVEFVDGFAGVYRQEVDRKLGDFPLARDIDGAGYTLACCYDDLVSGVTEVVRGDDLLMATPAQLLLARALSPLTKRTLPPAYFHVPLMVGADGKRLAKRHGDTRLSALRTQGVSAARLRGYLAYTCGWAEMNEELGLQELLSRYDPASIPHAPIVVNFQGNAGA